MKHVAVTRCLQSGIYNKCAHQTLVLCATVTLVHKHEHNRVYNERWLSQTPITLNEASNRKAFRHDTQRISHKGQSHSPLTPARAASYVYSFRVAVANPLNV